jgi:polysaccharide pyruvyl transferase WcaK-like protein
VLAVCPINPFWWPVKPSVPKFLARKVLGAYKQSYYRTIYFHKSGRDVDAQYIKYIAEMSDGVDAFRKRHKVFPILVGMERLDARACQAIAERLPGVPVFTSDEHNMYQMVSVLRCCSLMLSSRFHAIVTSMPGLVPSAGVTMDERIHNLMHERGHDHLVFKVDEEGLAAKITEALETLWRDADDLREGIGRSVVRNLKLMAKMGTYLERYVHEIYPEFSVRSGVHSWEEYLPPLDPTLQKLVERYDSVAVTAGAGA